MTGATGQTGQSGTTGTTGEPHCSVLCLCLHGHQPESNFSLQGLLAPLVRLGSLVRPGCRAPQVSINVRISTCCVQLKADTTITALAPCRSFWNNWGYRFNRRDWLHCHHEYALHSLRVHALCTTLYTRELQRLDISSSCTHEIHSFCPTKAALNRQHAYPGRMC